MSNVPFGCDCPVCEEKLTHAYVLTEDGPVGPKPLDIAICASCHSLLEFQEDLSAEAINIETLEPAVQDVIVMTITHLQETRPRVLH